MEQYTDSQYDDDLTVGMEDSEESFDTGFVDLFEHSGGEESPIARLKTIVLSLDWEINDQVLTQFNEELLALRAVWSDDQVRLVYLQALEKVSKYIYQQRSDAHPNAIKLLLTFYYNLEKIVLNEGLEEVEVKAMLREDVRKFEQLKQQIKAITDAQPGAAGTAHALPGKPLSETAGTSPLLFDLKASILGMDWEITDKELGDLGKEVSRLEKAFVGNKPRLLFLQGIGALGGYIKLKKSNAHSDAFKLLYSFYEGLEKIVETSMTRAEEKVILLAEVEKFEEFKQIIAPTITPEALAAEAADDGVAGADGAAAAIAPAFADVPDEVQGFQAEQEAGTLAGEVPLDVESKLEHFFSDQPGHRKGRPGASASEDGGPLPKEALEKIESFFGEEEINNATTFSVSAEEALRGVDVETDADDDSEEEALPTRDDGIPLPALSESEEDLGHGFNPDIDDQAQAGADDANVAESVGGFFDEEESAISSVPEAALAGVDVETEADDDSDEPPLPVIDSQLAPALSFEEVEEERSVDDDEPLSGDIKDRLDTFFDEDNAAAVHEAGAHRSADDRQHAAQSQPFRQVDDTQRRTAEQAEDGALERQSAPDEAPVFTLADQESTDEVVFKAVTETDLMSTDAVPVAVLKKDEADSADLISSFGSDSDEQDFFASIDERVDEPGEFQMEILDESDELEDSLRGQAGEPLAQPGLTGAEADAQTLGSEQPTVDQKTTQDQADNEEFSFTTDDPLAGLRAGIASLGIEISEQIIAGIYSEVNSLRQQMLTKPVEKTFLQLLSTIVQHIGQYRYEASAEALGLLRSVFDKLELVQSADIVPEQAQETLLAETCKVLLWQQKMLDRQAVKKGDQLTFIAPVRAASSAEAEAASVADVEQFLRADQPGDFSAVFEPVEEDHGPVSSELPEATDFNAIFEEVPDAQAQQMNLKADEHGHQRLLAGEKIRKQPVSEASEEHRGSVTEPPAGLTGNDEPPLVRLVKQEIKALRQSLHEEIRALKEQLKNK